MPKILSSKASQAVGRPGFRSFKYGNFKGRLGVKRLFARDPAAANSIMGTSKDVVGSVNQTENLVGSVSPRVLKAPHDAHEREPKARVVNRSANRRLKKR